ncbi:MAG: methylenetetrahydrofolate reductase [Rhizobiales bacterium]|nr:methylenetetrahydrofolate reductase [Hyphomicrobiales bacterium]
MGIKALDLTPGSIPMSAANAFIPASIEISPKAILAEGAPAGLFPPGTRTYITDIGNHSHLELATVARRLTDAGYRPVQHIAARRLNSAAELESHIKRLTQEAGLDDVLIVAGEPNRQMGPYASTMDILRSGVMERNGIKFIAVGGHPEGNPSAPKGQDYPILREKADFQSETNAQMRIVTQFGFDGEAFANWAWHVKAIGINLPIHLGVAGPAKMTTLLRFAAIAGIGNSMKFLKKRAGALTALATTPSPEPVVKPIEKFWQENPDGPVAQMHVFPFGGVNKSAEWLAQRGSWNIKISLYGNETSSGHA